MTHSPLVYVLIPAHNRRVTTLLCLKTLQQNGDLDRYTVVVIDDGSTDGTADAIRAAYSTVTILEGDGTLWWTGAIVKGMEYAYCQGADYFIWLNDDTLPLPEALEQMVVTCSDTSRQIITAQCYSQPTLTQPTYGGRRVGRWSLQLFAARPHEKMECDVCSGNLVCLPRSVIEAIGYPPNQRAPQTWADVIYTWRAKQADFEIKVLGAAIAICPTNPLEEGWASSQIKMSQRWQMLGSPKSSIYPPAYWFYCQQIYGFWGVIPFSQVYLKLILFTVVRIIVPLSWLATLRNLKNNWLAPISKAQKIKQ
jgi:GT2 family glycosyltransferase